MRCLTFCRTTLPTASSVGAKKEEGRPVRRLLQLSRQDMVVAWARVVTVQAVRRGQILDTCCNGAEIVDGFVVGCEGNMESGWLPSTRRIKLSFSEVWRITSMCKGPWKAWQ